MKNLGDLQRECANLEIHVETQGRASKEPYIVALRNYHWQKEHPGEPLPAQTMPMLLSSWEDLEEDEAEAIEHDHHVWIVQPKLDGVRALIHIEQARVRITSRTVSEVTYRLSEFQDNLPHLVQALSQFNGSILDGELLCPVSRLDTGSTVTEASLQASMAVLASAPAKARQFQESQHAHVRFHAFDVLRHRSQDVTKLPLIERQVILEQLLRQCNSPFVERVPTFVVNKGSVHDRIIANGGEGTVWKRADSNYEPGRRVRHWIKRKAGVEVEAYVSGFKLGHNGHAGMVGAIEFSTRMADGSTVPVGWVSGWSDKERLAMTLRDADGAIRLNPTILGRRAVLVGQDKSSKSRRLRHARLKTWIAS